jgi:adenylosuccinate lyase
LKIRSASAWVYPFSQLRTKLIHENRIYDYQRLAGSGVSLYEFSFDLKLVQSSTIGNLLEPFRQHKVGSSAMPFKRNPVQAEKIDSLARFSTMPQVAW